MISGFSILIIEEDKSLAASSTYSFKIYSFKYNLAMASDNLINDSNCLTVILYEELFDTSFDHAKNAVTIGGWLTEKEGDIPISGAKIVTNDFLFQILSSSKSRVDKIYIRRLKS